MTGPHPRAPWELRLAARTRSGLPRSTVLLLLTTVLIVWTVVAWPRLTLPFAADAEMVAAVDGDVLHDGVGLSEAERDGVRGAIGTRPLVMLFVPELVRENGDPRPRDVCEAVDSRITGVIVAVIAGGEFSYLCGTDSMPHRGTWTSFDIYTSMSTDRVLTFLDGNPVEQAQAFGLLYDSWVGSDRVAPTERELRADDDEVLAAAGIAALTAGGVVAALLALRGFLLLLVGLRVRAERRRRLRERLDDRLAELALLVVTSSPADPRRDPRTGAEAAAGYLELVVDVRDHPERAAAQLARAEELLGGRDLAGRAT